MLQKGHSKQTYQNHLRELYLLFPFLKQHSDIIYGYIYDNVVDYCVEQIEAGNYTEAYDRYKSSVINFEGKIARPYLGKRLVKALPVSES